MSARLPLSAAEARVLGVLVEKQATVPDSYPLSLNALVAGCNQKTAREPAMSLADGEVLQAIDGLKSRSLVVESSGSRVLRFEHNGARGLGVPSQGLALLAVLALRGPLTAAELRLHSERLHRFADVSSVEAFLDELAAREPPLVARLPRAPGTREARWAQRLTAEAAAEADAVAAAAEGEDAATGTPLRDELAALRAELQSLRAEVDGLRAQLAALGGGTGTG